MAKRLTITKAAFAVAVTIALADTGHAASLSCSDAAEQLVTLVKNNWLSAESTPGAIGDLISTFSRKSPPGFALGTARFRLTTYSRQAFVNGVKRLQKPFAPSGELLTALDDLNGNLALVGLPGTDILAANSIGGTAYCNYTVFFSVKNGQSRVVKGPEQWENDVGGGCGVTRSFVAVGGVPFVIDDSLDSGPRLSATLTLTPWADGKWLEPCAATFEFAPHYDTRNMQNDWPSLNNWDKNDCGDCDGLRRAALELVRQTQSDRNQIEARLLAAMTMPQQEEYQRLKRISGRADPADTPTAGDEPEKPATAADLTDSNPLVLPLIADGRVFLATAGHFTIGWRVFSDWKVTIESGEADKTREIARFAVGMTQGPIVGAIVR